MYLPTIAALRTLLEAKEWSSREREYPHNRSKEYTLSALRGLVHFNVEHDPREARVYWQVVAGGVIEKSGWTRSLPGSQARAIREGAKVVHNVLKDLYS